MMRFPFFDEIVLFYGFQYLSHNHDGILVIYPVYLKGSYQHGEAAFSMHYVSAMILCVFVTRDVFLFLDGLDGKVAVALGGHRHLELAHLEDAFLDLLRRHAAVL